MKSFSVATRTKDRLSNYYQFSIGRFFTEQKSESPSPKLVSYKIEGQADRQHEGKYTNKFRIIFSEVPA